MNIKIHLCASDNFKKFPRVIYPRTPLQGEGEGEEVGQRKGMVRKEGWEGRGRRARKGQGDEGGEGII
jgi:hypothetical protein